jgi:hypothetical protein
MTSRESLPQLYSNTIVSNNKVTQDEEPGVSGDTDDDSLTGKGGSGSLGSKNGDHVHVPEKFGGGNASLSAAVGKSLKKKPKNNIAKSNSSFVLRIVTHDNLNKRLAERNPVHLMVFATINRAFNWLDMGSPIKVLFFFLPVKA